MTPADWWPFEILVPVAVLFYYLSDLYLLGVPSRASRLQRKGRTEEAILLLENAVRRRVVAGGESTKIAIRYELLLLYQSMARYTDAAREAEALLDLFAADTKMRRYGAAEADIRRRLADAYEALGRAAETVEQRRQASAIQASVPASKQGASTHDAGWHREQGVQWERQNRYREAAAEFKQAMLKLGPATSPDIRAQMELRLSLALDNAGQSAEALKHARTAIASAKSTLLRLSAHRQAAHLCRNLNLLEDAHRYQQTGLEIARAEGTPTEVSLALASGASNRRLLGDISGAQVLLDQAAEISGNVSHVVRAMRRDCQMTLGDFTGMIESLYSEDGLTIRDFENRLVAVQAMAVAIAHIELDDPDRALASLEMAEEELADEKLYRVCRAIRLEAEALLVRNASGLLNDAAQTAASGETPCGTSRETLHETLHEMERECLRLTTENDGDPVALRDSLPHIARAAASLGEYETGLRLWALYAEASPRPVEIPELWLYKGDCRRGLGDIAGARGCYREAVSTGIETVWTCRAREWLSEMEDGAASAL